LVDVKEGTDMTLPEHTSPKRRRQILDDETGAHRFDASAHENTWPHEELAPDASAHEDVWVRSFMTRLAGLIRNLDGKKRCKK
jgi:hypothetical protein